VEIGSYLHIIRRRLWILLLVPLLAAAGVAAWQLREPNRYEATATVAAPTVLGTSTVSPYLGGGGSKAFVADFRAAITSPLIVTKVADETGARPADIKNGLVAGAIGDSSLVQVTYRTSERDQAAPVAQSAASHTIRFLFQTQVTLAGKTVGEAQKAIDKINSDLAAFYRKTGQVLPDEAYRIKAQQVSDLEREQASAEAGGESITASGLESRIRESKQELAALAPQVAEYQSLIDRREQASTRMNLLEEGLERARAQFNAADPQAVVTVGTTEKVNIVPEVVKTAAPAFAAGLILAVCIVLLLELGTRRDRDDEDEDVRYPVHASSPEYARSRT
jgi:capsular polysaccharide biosynthesis protein